MQTLQLKEPPVVKTGMLFRRPATAVFDAFVNPEITTQFWFSKSTGRLQVGKTVQWEWETYGIAIPVTAKLIEPNKRIVVEWPGRHGATTVEWRFESQSDGFTFVRITEQGFSGDGDDLVAQLLDSMGGFSLVLAAAKALLEHNVHLSVVADRYPSGIEPH